MALQPLKWSAACRHVGSTADIRHCAPIPAVPRLIEQARKVLFGEAAYDAVLAVVVRSARR